MKACPSLGEQSVDVCVVPFESRLGVHDWRFRRIPIRHKIPAVISYNGRGRLREWSYVRWILNSLLICVGVGAIHAPAVWVWLRLRRWLDVMALFSLAVSALALCGVSRLGLHPLSRTRAGRLEAGRRRLVLFIPSLGMGGAQRQMVSYLTRLDRDQWEPELVMLDLPDKFFEPAARELGIPITYLNAHHEFWMVGVAWRLARYLHAKPCDVLHSWMHYAAMIGAIAGTMAGVPTIIGSLRSERPGRFPWFYPIWQRAIDVLTAPLHTYLIANSNAVRVESQRWAFIPERKLVTIYNGIQSEQKGPVDGVRQQQLRADLNLPAGVPVVGIVGRLCPEKDHATFLQAGALIARKRPETQYLIVGDGNLRGWIEQESERLGLSGKVHLLGRRKDAVAVIQLLDVLVLTSTTEGFPNVLLEAAMAGTPVVTTAAGGASEVVLNGETGFVVPCGDAEAVAGRVLELLAAPSLRKQFSEAALARVQQHFSAEHMASEIQACYLRGFGRADSGPVLGRRLRVCFISSQVYGLLRPSSGVSWGGAEVQIAGLASRLARDPRFEISVLTGDCGRVGKEQHGEISIILSALFAKLQARHGAQPTTMIRVTIWSRFVLLVRSGLDRLPSRLAGGIRWLIRKGYACRGLLLAPCMPPFHWLAQRVREGQRFAQLMRDLRAADADVYVMRCASPQVGYVRLASTLMRRKFVYMVAHEIDVSGRYARAHGVWGRRFEWGLQRADATVCQHEDQINLLRSQYGRKGQLIRSLCPTPVDTATGRLRRTILWVSRMDGWKQPELFIELADRIPEASFVMLGPPSETDSTILPRLQERMASVRNLRWLGRMSFEDAGSLFQEAMLFVNTSQFEGFPNTFLQAAACGTPIVSWSVNPERFLDRYEIGYCANRDWSRFEYCVRLLCADASLRARLGENGRRYVHEHHNPVAIASEYAELLLALGKKRAGAAIQVTASTAV